MSGNNELASAKKSCDKLILARKVLAWFQEMPAEVPERDMDAVWECIAHLAEPALEEESEGGDIG